MQITVEDRSPGASEGRDRYFRARIDRALGPLAGTITAAKLEVEREDDDTEVWFRLRLALELAEGSTRAFVVRRPDLLDGLRAVFESAGDAIRSDEAAKGPGIRGLRAVPRT